MRTASSPTSALVERAKRGSADAVEELVSAHWAEARGVAFSVTGDAHGAQDVAQEAMLAAIRGLPGFDRGRSFRPWLHQIVVNRSLDWLRARERRHEVELQPEHHPLQDPGIEGDSDALVAALRILQPRDRAIVALRYVGAFNSSEIADLLGIPAATVRTSLARSLTKLRAQLGEPPTEVPMEASVECPT